MNEEEADFLAAVERRRAEIDERLEQLRARRREIAKRGWRGSTPADVESAEERALAARRHAETAHERAARRYLLAAESHENAATTLMAAGVLEAAERHRRAAIEARGAAERSLAEAAAEREQGGTVRDPAGQD
ncbi:hypothetical protein LWC33_28525 [Pseudonocardia sp. RS11V-5]|uniref:hypothetical protein n=1 Tax=Pseudonocardia terrae TaxID=2905831 RepID=UPI001E62FB1F|nr:hypothetical protein [Pseudonocardia terrae]MCE3555380.1 hypothetical protein [Pseudonocardia terrae]